MIRVDKNVAIPKSTTKPYKYPWHELEIGDSFLIPNGYSPYSLLRAFNGKRAKKDQIKIKSAKEKGGVRVWRIK